MCISRAVILYSICLNYADISLPCSRWGDLLGFNVSAIKPCNSNWHKYCSFFFFLDLELNFRLSYLLLINFNCILSGHLCHYLV